MSNVPSYAVCIAIFQYSVINISISNRQNASIFYMYTVCVAGNCLVKFALMTDSYLLNIGSQSCIIQKSIQKISMAFFVLRSLPVCQKVVNFEGTSRNFEMSTF